MMKDPARRTMACFALPAAALALVLSAPAALAQAPAAPVQAPPAARPAVPAKQVPAKQAVPAAPAKQAAPAAAAAPAAPATAAGPAPEWLKVCGKDETQKTEVCQIASYIVDNAGNVRGQIRVLDVKREKDPKRLIEAMVQPGFLIQPGINLVIDDSKTPIPGRYRICFPNACVADVALGDDVLANIRKGQSLGVFFANPQGQWLGAKVSLAGFNAAFDGPALDPKVAEEKRKAFEAGQNKLQAELAKRAEEQRKKLQDKTEVAPALPPAAAKTQ